MALGNLGVVLRKFALEVIGLFESAKNAMIFDKNALHIWLGDIKIDGMALKNFSRGANSW